MVLLFYRVAARITFCLGLFLIGYALMNGVADS